MKVWTPVWPLVRVMSRSRGPSQGIVVVPSHLRLWCWCCPRRTWSLVLTLLETAVHLRAPGCGYTPILPKVPGLFLWCVVYMRKAKFHGPGCSMGSTSPAFDGERL